MHNSTVLTQFDLYLAVAMTRSFHCSVKTRDEWRFFLYAKQTPSNTPITIHQIHFLSLAD